MSSILQHPIPPPISEAQYLTAELTASTRNEYIDGQTYAMTGASYNHNCVAANLLGEFRSHLKGTPCATFMADLKLKIGRDYVYPDVMVDCSKIAGNDYFSSTPILIVEVLSRSTRKIDSTVKLLKYINLPSLQEYVMIEPDIVSVQVLRRSQNWRPEYFYLGDTVRFESIDLSLAVETIYERVDNLDMREWRSGQTAE